MPKTRDSRRSQSKKKLPVPWWKTGRNLTILVKAEFAVQDRDVRDTSNHIITDIVPERRNVSTDMSTNPARTGMQKQNELEWNSHALKLMGMFQAPARDGRCWTRKGSVNRTGVVLWMFADAHMFGRSLWRCTQLSAQAPMGIARTMSALSKCRSFNS
jgi:hypothetical protein